MTSTEVDFSQYTEITRDDILKFDKGTIIYYLYTSSFHSARQPKNEMIAGLFSHIEEDVVWANWARAKEDFADSLSYVNLHRNKVYVLNFPTQTTYTII